MTATELEEIGTALYGPRWQTQLAADLGVSARHVRFWLAGERTTPQDLSARLGALCKERGGSLLKLARELRQ